MADLDSSPYFEADSAKSNPASSQLLTGKKNEVLVFCVLAQFKLSYF